MCRLVSLKKTQIEVAHQPAHILEDAPEYLFGRAHRLFVTVWRKETPASCLSAFAAFLENVHRDFEGNYSALTIAEPSAPPPSSEVRRELAKMIARYPPLASALVVEGSWFRVAAVRSVSTAVMLLSRPGFEQRVVPSVPEALIWLEAVLRSHGFDDLADVDNLDASIDQLRARHVASRGTAA